MQCWCSKLRIASLGSQCSLLLCVVLLGLLSPTAARSRLRTTRVATADIDAAFRTATAESEGAPQPVRSSVLRSNVLKRVKQKLVTGHRDLGQVSAALISVQAEVDKTEKSMLGRVLDLQSSHYVFDRHGKIVSSNRRMVSNIAKLNKRAAALSSKLSKARKTRAANNYQNSLAEKKIRFQVAEDAGIIADLSAELEHREHVRASLKKLRKVHRELVAALANGTRTDKELRQMLWKAQSARRVQKIRQKKMKAHLDKLFRYNLGCHASVEKAAQLAGASFVAHSKDEAASQILFHQKQVASEAKEKQLTDELSLLTSEAAKAEELEKQEMDNLKSTRISLKEMEETIVSEVSTMGEKITVAKWRLKQLNATLSKSTQEELEATHKQQAIQARLSRMKKQLHHAQNPLSQKAMQDQNDLLQAELNRYSVSHKAAMAAEEAAALAVKDAEAELAAAKKALQAAQEAAVVAHAETNKTVANAIAEANQRVHQVHASQCSPQWDSIWKEKRAELVKCKAMQKELHVEITKKDAMQQNFKYFKQAF